MTKQEEIMYEIISAMTNTDLPIVFKGGLVLKLLLKENGFEEIERMTKDIDASWIGTAPTMAVIAGEINQCLEKIHPTLVAIPSREYGERRSGGIRIVEKETEDEITSMDIDIKPALGDKEYSVGDIKVRGIISDEILADKISVLSGDYIFRRVKDMVDVYALAHCITIKVNDIFSAFQKTGRVCGKFQKFLNQKEDLEHAYNKLNIVKGKPSFEEIYSYLLLFLEPFYNDNPKSNSIWDNDKKEWSGNI